MMPVTARFSVNHEKWQSCWLRRGVNDSRDGPKRVSVLGVLGLTLL